MQEPFCPLYRQRDHMCSIKFKANGLKGDYKCDDPSISPHCKRRQEMHESWKVKPTPLVAPTAILSGRSEKRPCSFIMTDDRPSGSATRPVRILESVNVKTVSSHEPEHKGMDDVMADAITKEAKK